MKYLLLASLFVSLQSFAQTEERPRTGSINGISISGMEYWPFDDAIPGSPYPNRIIWHYDGGSERAKACMLKANKFLVGMLENPEDPVAKGMAAIKNRGGTARFFMWTNDYTKAPNQADSMREASMWNWQNAYQKFESTVTPTGECKMPSKEQILAHIETELESLPAPANQTSSDRSVPRGDAGSTTDRPSNGRNGSTQQ